MLESRASYLEKANIEMELSTQEAEIPMPLNSVYGGVHAHVNNAHTHAHQGNNMTHHEHHLPIQTTTMHFNTNNNNGKTNTSTPNYHEVEEPKDNDQGVSYNNDTTNSPTIISIRYKECQKNHAASIGGKALDGCGEFMPSGDEGTIQALICSVCNCHRNFHRKEIDGYNCNHNQYPYAQHFYLPSTHPHPKPHHIISTRGGRKVLLGSGNSGNSSSGGLLGYPTSVGRGGLIPLSMAMPLNVSYKVGLGGRVGSYDEHQHEDDHGNGNGNGNGGGGVVVMMRTPHQMVKRRVRTKFSQEQKEKMLEFAEKVGWKIQKQEDSVVQQFCQEIGIKRRVLKVWMHNNKHTFAKKCIDDNNYPNTNNDSTTTSNLFN